MNKRLQRKEETHARLMRAARRLFLEQPYDEISVNTILAATGLTKGGFYFHVADKRALFRAVTVEVNQDLARRMDATAEAAATPWDGLIGAFRVFFEILEEPGMHRFFYRDGITVLGFADWMAINRENSLASTERLANRLIATGELQTRHPSLFGLLVCGACDYVSDQAFDRLKDEPDAMRQAADAVIDLLERFHTPSDR